MDITRDIQTLSEFKQNASKFVKQVQETGQPIILTVNGRPAIVVQDPRSFQQMIDAREYQETVAALREAVDDLPNSSTWQTHDEAFSGIRERVGLPKRIK